MDSAGTHGYHIGEPPDARSISTALVRGGVDMRDLRARQVSGSDFKEFDWLIAMDRGHHGILDQLGGPSARPRILRFLSFTGQAEGDVPDPYYGGQAGFDAVYDMVEAGCNQILARIRADLGI